MTRSSLTWRAPHAAEAANHFDVRGGSKTAIAVVQEDSMQRAERSCATSAMASTNFPDENCSAPKGKAMARLGYVSL